MASSRTDRLTRTAVKALPRGQRLTSRGITAERLSDGDVRFIVNVMVDGERIHRAIGRESEGVTITQAEEFIELARTRAREQRLDLPRARKLHRTFTEAAADYLKRLESEGGKLIERKRQHLDGRLVPHLGKLRLDAITESALRGFIKARQDEGAAAGSINRELATLSHLLRRAAEWKWIGRGEVVKVPRLKEGQGRIIALSPEQAAALQAGAIGDQDPDLWLFVMIGLHTSMRHGEIKRLRWEHFDAHRRRFWLPEAKAGEREQPMTGELAAALSREMASRKLTSGFMFPPGNARSKSEHRDSFRKAFRRAAKRAGLDPDAITPHVMRHTAITRLVKAGVDLPTIQRISGHKTLSMVLRYSHVDGLHIDAAAEALSAKPITPKMQKAPARKRAKAA